MRMRDDAIAKNIFLMNYCHSLSQKIKNIYSLSVISLTEFHVLKTIKQANKTLCNRNNTYNNICWRKHVFKKKNIFFCTKDRGNHLFLLLWTLNNRGWKILGQIHCRVFHTNFSSFRPLGFYRALFPLSFPPVFTLYYVATWPPQQPQYRKCKYLYQRAVQFRTILHHFLTRAPTT